MEQKKELKRIPWVDILKGLLIIFVIFGHITTNSHIKNYLSTFFMPCFFILSGWFMKKNNDIGNFVKKRFKSILLPYVFFSLIWIVFNFLKNFIIRSDFNIFKALLSVLLPYSGSPGGNVYILWFLPCLFFSQIIVALIIYDKIFLRVIGVIIWMFCLVLGILIEPYCSLLYAVSIASIFVFIGFIIPNYILINKKIESNLLNIMLIIISLVINIICFIINVYYFKNNLDFSAGLFGILPIYLIGATSGSFFLILLFSKIKSLKPLEFIGKNSLAYYALHYIVLAVISFIVEKIININYIVIPLSFITVLVITTLIVMLYNKLNIGKIFR